MYYYVLAGNFLHYVGICIRKTTYCVYCHFCDNLRHLNINSRNGKTSYAFKLLEEMHRPSTRDQSQLLHAVQTPNSHHRGSQ